MIQLKKSLIFGAAILASQLFSSSASASYVTEHRHNTDTRVKIGTVCKWDGLQYKKLYHWKIYDEVYNHTYNDNGTLISHSFSYSVLDFEEFNWEGELCSV